MDRSRGSRGPIGGRMSNIVVGLARRFSLPSLEVRYNNTAVLGTFAFVNGLISIGLMAAAALATRAPFVFPSLGPTAFLFFYTPLAASASPRNTVYGHLIGMLAGWFSLVVFGLSAAGPTLSVGFSGARIGAAALSLALTAGVMVWLRVPHPSAGATTLLVSLGLLTRPVELGVLLLAVVLLTLQAIVINRLAGLDYPLWKPQSLHSDSTESR
jgi:CBS domain-containing membrane protein